MVPALWMGHASFFRRFVETSIVADQAIEEAVCTLQILDVDQALLVVQLRRQRYVHTTLQMRVVRCNVGARHKGQLERNDVVKHQTAG
jgi:hypothetical protein